MAISSETARENARAAAAKKPATVVKPTPTPTPTPKPKPIPAAKTSAQMTVDAQKVLDQVNAITTRYTTIESNLSKIVKDSGFFFDPSGNVVDDYVVSSTYVGTGKDRQRVDTMKSGNKRTFLDPDLNYEEPVLGTTNVQVIKATLKGRGLPTTLVDDSVPFFMSLQKEGLDEDSIVEIYLNNKDYTTKDGKTVTSPFYSKYGFYNDKVTNPYDAKVLYQTVEGYKATATKYGLDTKFTSDEYIQSYLINKVSVKTFDDNANTARLLAITADPARIKALTDLGYISGAQNLTDFYLDKTIGTEQMKQRVNTAAVAIEAVRRANAATGIAVDTENIKKYGAELTAKGLSENEIAALASKGYENIAETLAPTTKLAQIYDKGTARTTSAVQAELEKEQFQGIESQLKKRVAAQEIGAFSGRSGLTSGSLKKSTYGQI